MAARVVHFEIQADDLDRARAFYGDCFGWTFADWSQVTGSPYWGIITGEDSEPGINGGLMARGGGAPVSGAPVNGYVCTVQVEDYDLTEQKILAAGGTVAVPKTALPGMAWQGYYVDCEGNILGIHQPDPQAG